MTWLLLIYTVPAEPSRKRAAIWREIKRAGAIYIRDGVCVLPERDSSLAAFEGIASNVGEFGGQATLARGVVLDQGRSEAIFGEARQARSAEYADLAQEIHHFVAHIHREREHRDFSLSEIEELEADLGKLRRWLSQIEVRDFGPLGGGGELHRLLDNCESEIGSFIEDVFKQEEAVP